MQLSLKEIYTYVYYIFNTENTTKMDLFPGGGGKKLFLFKTSFQQILVSDMKKFFS